MPVLSENESRTDERLDSLLHIRNLPWSAGRKDIREYFKELSINDILLRGAEAFVEFKDSLDLALALCQKERPLNGTCIHISAISKDELQRALLRCARRKLDFGNSNEVCTVPLAIRAPKRKIRPTPVSMSRKRRAVTNLVFLSNEVKLPCPQYVANVPIVSQRKKVHPTKVSDDMEVERFTIFHPEKCCDFKDTNFCPRAACAIKT